MSRPSLVDPLYFAATLTFEEMALLCARLLPEPIEDAAEAEVSVAFTGPLHGRIVVRTFDGVLPVLAANLLGEDNAPAPELQRDALGEVANVICGNLLPALGGRDALFRLEAPRAGAPRGAAPVPAAPEPDAGVALDLECGRAQVLLFLADPAHGGAAP